MDLNTSGITPDHLGFDLGRCVAFDLECYPDGRWCVGFHGPDREGEPRTWIVDRDRGQLKTTLERLGAANRILVGYNSERFDVPLLRMILKGLDPYAPAQSIIRGEPLPVPLSRLPPLGCDHIDLSARVRRGGGFPSLKTLAANLGRPTLRELPYSPETVLSDDQWAEVKSYNEIDLGHTWAILERFAPELQALAAISEEQGQDLRSTPTPRVVETVFRQAYRTKRGADPVQPEQPGEVLYRGVPGVVRPRTDAAASWHDQIVNTPLPVIDRGGRPTVDVPRARFPIGKLDLSVGSGGLHSIDKPRVYYSTRTHQIVSVDVASYYPSLIATKAISPRSYGDVGAATYRGILNRRLEVKRLAKNTDDPAEKERLDVQSTALKLVLNSTFGKLGDSYSSLFDLESFLAVTLSGQLMLIDLIERLTAVGVRIISGNTDGLFIRVRRRNKRWKKVLAEWQRDTEMELEVDPLKRLLILATNRFATLDEKGRIKRKGDGVKGNYAPLSKNDSPIIADAVVAALLQDVPPEKTILGCPDLLRFCRVTTRSRKVVKGVIRDDSKELEHELPKVARWYKEKDSPRRIIHRFADGRRTTPSHAVGVNLALDLQGNDIPRGLDFAWYMGQARRGIQGIPGYRHRSTKLLAGHKPALDVIALGLSPAPKRGKQQPAGSDAKAPTFLYDWPSYPTVGVNTGPEVATLAIDVDDAVKFKAKVDRGNSPLLANRWHDLAGALVSYHGDATAKDVRRGLDKGKLIFRLPGDDPRADALSRIAVGHWRRSWGIDVFYGKGMPSVLGDHPDGSQYQLEGSLTDAPEWLLEALTPRRRIGEKVPAVRQADAERTPIDPEALEGLTKELAELAPELGQGSVGWRAKELGDGRTIWVGRCPFEHDSGASDPGDLSAGYDAEARPYVRCLHTSCQAIPEISARLRAAHHRQPETAEVAPIELTEIAEAMLQDLAKREVALHRAPTGSGKSHGITLLAAERYRQDKLTLIALPTVRLAAEMVDRLKGIVPDAFETGAVAAIFGRRAKLTDGDIGDDDDEGEADEGSYPIEEWTRIVVCTHAQLGRRGFSRFVRGIWERIEHQKDKDGEVIRGAFAIVVDEVGEFIRQSRIELPLEHRTRLRYEPDRSGGTLDPLKDCPKSTRSGNCANCRAVGHGGTAKFNRFQIREMRHPYPIEIDADGKPLRSARNPLRVDRSDLTLAEKARVGDTTFAAAVLEWKGRPIQTETRRAAPTYVFATVEGSKQHPPETPDEVLGHMLEFARQPMVTWEQPMTSEGKIADVEVMSLNISSGVKNWDEGVIFPLSTCGVGRLRLTDMLGLEKLRRYRAKERVGIILAGATLTPDDVAVLADVWPDLAERTHPYPDRRIKQVALVFTEGVFGIGSLVDHQDRLVTHPLESIGLGMVFCGRKRTATSLFDHIADAQPTARLAIENFEQVSTRKTLHAFETESPVRTWLTYSRGILGLGVNMPGLRHLIVDANAFRAIASFTPTDVTPEEFRLAQAEERAALILQNIGRALRGEQGKTVVLIVLNADPAIIATLAASEAILQGSELPPVVASGDDLPELVDQARRWLEAGGGEWPEGRPEARKPRKTAGRKPSKNKDDVMRAAEESLASGMPWREFHKKNQPQRQLSPEEVVALKERFKSKVPTK